ncbi:MAG: MFS transporter [Clostridia bacterium]|nr:MFS transporter [Clostridia bacterium]
MMTKLNHKHTLTTCFSGYITQSIVVNFIPLLFLTFCSDYAISLEKVTVLVTMNFFLQLLTDLISAKLIGKIGYRAGIVGANALSTIGLMCIAILPDIIDPYFALCLGMVLCAIGSGLEEVLISPIVDACPTKRKSAIMSLAHSFYCWGTVVIIALSTAFFAIFGMDKWKILTLIWAIIPTINAILFSIVPIYNGKDYGEKSGGFKKLFSSGIFWFFALMMICAGASELSMGQWASAFAESALKVDKAIGDMAGACLFALMMAISRTVYATFSDKINLKKYIIVCSVLAICAYALVVFSPFAWLSLVACGLCGFAVGIMWPGTLSIAANVIGGSTALFAMYAVFGDIGATIGPTIVGFVSGAFNDNLKIGLACIIVFPALLLIGMLLSKKKKSK